MRVLRIRGSLRERNYVRTVSLVTYQEDTPWYTMYATRDSPSFISTVSLTPYAFDILLTQFKKHYVVKSLPYRSGRPPRIPHKHAVLAMILHFYTAAVEAKTLQELFGLSQRSQDGMRDARISWPTKATQALWARKTQEREPLVSGVLAFVDGKNFGVQVPTNTDLQNAQYNGWLHSVFVSGVLCFGLDGTLIWGRHNCPGSWNDGEMSRRLQEILADNDKVGHGKKLASDSAFPVGGRCAGKIVTPLKEGDLERYPEDYISTAGC
ncbi:hypothetical protein AaE_009872 [Aphanomyces astaci]|uniref:DDE Tnp4 domain-containing protein n=1 Tax=Aphanomyces astaci TaxID=112090 RepID=A0A6A5A0Q6_APHAT|nr:hypothetical protein AaE_009872 [Aphanomyces astaci]